jgi:hypothetical protein
VCPECGDVWMDAYSSARFTELEVRPSSLIYGADNRVQVDFSLDRLMPSGSKIQIHVDPLRLKLSNGEGTVFGRSRIWFEPAAKWIDEPPGLVVTSTQNIPAHTRLSFSVMFVNSDDATGSADLDVQVSSRSDFFSSLLGQSWASAGRLKSAAVLTRMVGPAFSSTAMPKFRKIIMMDITVLGSVFISSLDVHLPSNVTSQTLDIYYKEGSYASAKKNLTEWRLLGRVTTQDLPRHGNVAVRLRLSDLKSQFSEGEARQYADQMQDLAGLAGFTPIQTWLGARPSWVNNSARHMSSTLGSGVDLRKVFNLSHAGLWHSGNGTGTWSEAGCPHLPKCPVHWPFDKNQWIAFDTGVCYTLSAFRTVFPNYTQAPTYNFGGIKRNNINEDDWSQAHFRYFELQYSTTGLQGPWRAALNGEAQAGQSNQHFPFQPVTARYWRLLLMDNFGFGYFALKSIEFFGFESPWCADSRWCQASQECQTTQNDLISVQYNQDASLQQYGLALTAGLHSFMLSASHGLLVSDSDRRRSDVGKSDGTLMLHHAAQIDRKNDKARIEMERTFPLGKTKHLRLPTSSKLCHSRFRLVVKEMFNLTTGHGGASGRNVCLDQFALFEQMDPQWIVHNISSAQIAVDASSQLSGYLAETATNGQFAPGNLSSSSSATFCWNSEMIKPDEWISVTFPHSICVAGYALLDHDNQLSFSAWELQGSDDGGNWTILDRRRHEISKQRLWRKFALAESRPANYLFSNGLTYGYALSNEGGVEGESPRLHRFDDDAETWALGQLLGGGGVHDVEHFVVGQEHFLALARSLTSAGPEGVSEVMRWDGQAFVADHTLPIGWCTSIAYFAHNSSHYLVASDHGRDAPYTSSEVSVLKYQGATGGWAEVQRISQSPTSSIHVVQPYSAAGNLFLFVALSPLSTDCHGAFSCMQSAVFECDAGNRTQEISLHSSGYLVADANHSSRCRWIVAPPKASSVTLTFTKLDIVPCCRQIIVYSCADATCVSKTMLDNLVDSGSLDKISSSTGVLAVEYATYFPEVNVVHTSQPTSGTFFEARFDTTVAEPGPGSLITYKWKDKVVTVDYCSNEADCRARAGCDEGWCFEGTCFRGYTDPGCSAVEDGGRYAGQEEGFWCFSGRSDSYCPSVPSVQGQFETESDGEHVMHLDGVDTVALDLEPFESAHNPGEHFLAVATVPSSPLETSSDSLVYKLSSGRLQVWQRLAGPPAVRCKHIRKDGLDYLLIASYAGNSSIYRWNTIADSGIGRNGFTIAGHLPVSRTLSLEAFEAGGAVLLSLTASSGSKNGSLSASGSDSASGSGPMSQTTVVHVLRWMDALQWHGSFEYTDAFMPSASFAVRQLRETTLVPSGNRTYVATFQSDRSLPPGSTIRIMRITGVEQSEQHVEIFGQDAPVFGGLGLWEQASETLQITATRWIGSDHQISVGFSIGKGYKPRSALYAQISCSGSVIILPQDMETFGNGWPAQTGRLRQDCTRGHTAIDGWPCTACPPGTYKDTIGSAPCTPCAVGTFSPLTGRTLACDALCERGRYAIGGNSICDLCPAHTYTARQGSNLTNCTCNLGYTGLHGRACTSCIAGTFKDTNGSAACTRCAAGKYSTELAEIFEATCMVCPLYSDSMPGANNITNCSCNVGYTGERFMLCRIAYPAETPYFV